MSMVNCKNDTRATLNLENLFIYLYDIYLESKYDFVKFIMYFAMIVFSRLFS